MEERAERLNQLRLLRIAKGRNSLWEYCKLTAPEFYFEGREHLKVLCNALQAFMEKKIIRENGEWVFAKERSATDEVCHMFFIMIPPRHGKTRTLTKASEWILGKRESTKIMYTSYSDDAASDVSRFIRDAIDQVKVSPGDFVFSDFFDSELKRDSKASNKWSLKGEYLTFIASGKGGGVTGKGCDILVVDDPVKNAAEALSDLESEKNWKWFTDTLLSRVEEGGMMIVNHTRWPRRDLMQRLLDKYSDSEIKPYYQVEMQAYNYETEEMLCPEMLSLQSFKERRALVDVDIFNANYQQEVTDTRGRLYRGFMVYNKLKDYEDVLDGAICSAWCDVADSGKDYFGCIAGYEIGGEFGNNLLIRDIFYTDSDVQSYRDDFITWLIRNKVDRLKIESNNGGKGFAIYVMDEMVRRGGSTIVNWEYSSTNKETRIQTEAPEVMASIIFPFDWKERWPIFYRHVINYQRVGKNSFDDAPDILTMAATDLKSGGVFIWG